MFHPEVMRQSELGPGQKLRELIAERARHHSSLFRTAEYRRSPLSAGPPGQNAITVRRALHGRFNQAAIRVRDLSH
eukprot:scaffold7500_cov127-Isochrysis_galbana.AAC.1